MWISEWRAISARIEGLVGAGTFFLRTQDSDTYSVSVDLIENARRTVLQLFSFRDAYLEVLPSKAQKHLKDFLDSYENRFRVLQSELVSQRPYGFSGVTAAITPLESVRVEFDHLLSDIDELVRSLAVRAFLHLQRSIVADAAIRERWIEAHVAGETTCEKLGACHLLLHGIWAFKAVGAGEQTDLVMNEPLILNDDIRRASHGLVLTEWKIVKPWSSLRRSARLRISRQHATTEASWPDSPWHRFDTWS